MVVVPLLLSLVLVLPPLLLTPPPLLLPLLILLPRCCRCWRCRCQWAAPVGHHALLRIRSLQCGLQPLQHLQLPRSRFPPPACAQA